MTGSALRWPAPLDHPPSIRSIGRAVFEKRPIGRWKLDFWCLHLYRYRADLWLDGQPFSIRPGYAGIIPPRVDKEYHFKERSEHYCAHFFLPAIERPAYSLPAMQDLGKDFEAAWRAMEEATGFFPSQPQRAEARLWDLLWSLYDRPLIGAGRARRRSLSPPAQGPWHRARGVQEAGLQPTPVDQARKIIEQRLGQPLSVSGIAAEVGISHNQLTRLFRGSVGQTVVGYIRERRVQLAQHLLMHSTQPIKSIALEVGLGDLHFFNKTVRRAFGQSPRQIRAGRM